MSTKFAAVCCYCINEADLNGTITAIVIADSHHWWWCLFWISFYMRARVSRILNRNECVCGYIHLWPIFGNAISRTKMKTSFRLWHNRNHIKWWNLCPRAQTNCFPTETKLIPQACATLTESSSFISLYFRLNIYLYLFIIGPWP